MPLFLLLGLLCISLTAQAQYDAGGQNTQGANVDPGKLDPATKARIRAEGSVGGIPEDGASAGASGNAARTRAGSNASVEGGAALGATGINARPAAKAEESEKDERRRARQK